MPDLAKSIKANYRTRKKHRKYATNSTVWRKLRKAQLQRHPLCQHCTEQGRTTPANTVDHIDGNTYNNQASNFMSLCISCHSIKTNRHDGGLGRSTACP